MRLAVISDRSCDEDSDPLGHSGFSVLYLTTYYFEMISQAQSNKNDFKAGFKAVFPEKAELAAEVCSRLRNGIFHAGVPRSRIDVSRQGTDAIYELENGVIIINPLKWVAAIVEHFENYISELAQDSAMQIQFDRYSEREMKLIRKTTPVPTTPSPQSSWECRSS